LLALNAQIYYPAPPALLTTFAKTLLCAGLCFLPALLIHLHLEYADTRGMLGSRALKRTVLLAAYTPVFYFALHAYPLLANSPGFDFLAPGNVLGRGYGVWLALAMLISAAWEIRFHLRAPDRAQSFFHSLLAGVFSIGAALVVQLHVLSGPLPRDLSDAGEHRAGARGALAVGGADLHGAALQFSANRAAEESCVRGVGYILALLYLSLVRRLSGWLAPHIPPEATAAILLFLLVIFFEPLQRLLGRRLQETAHQEMDRVQRLMAEIQQEARQGNEKRSRVLLRNA